MFPDNYVDGKPVPAGRIFFNATSRRRTTVPRDAPTSKTGQFDTRQGGRSLVSGLVVVRIEGYDKLEKGRRPQELFVSTNSNWTCRKKPARRSSRCQRRPSKGLMPTTGPGP